LPEQIVEPAPDSPAFDSEALWARLSHENWQGRRVLVVRGDGGRDWFADTLRGAGAAVSFVSTYRRAAVCLDDAPRQRLLRQALDHPESHLWHFSSSEAARNLVAALGSDDLQRLRDARALATHPRIEGVLRGLGFGRVALVGAGPQAVADEVRSIQSRAS
jgi:uroporphyrinogen-III synthase